eukprot:Lankesteria_metandrocarpae@DN850_c0_g1_i1.p1
MTDSHYSQMSLSENDLDELLDFSDKRGFSAELQEAFRLSADDRSVDFDGHLPTAHTTTSTNMVSSAAATQPITADGTGLLRAGDDNSNDDDNHHQQEEDLTGIPNTTVTSAMDTAPPAAIARILDQQRTSTAVTKTCIFSDPACLYHSHIPEPTDFPMRRFQFIKSIPENSSRLTALVDPDTGILHADRFRKNRQIDWVRTNAVAKMADVLRVHDWSYIKHLRETVMESKVSPVQHASGYKFAPIDADTLVTAASWDAALAAAGCVITAVHSVCAGRYRNALCVVRPPGHHIGTWGAVQGGREVTDEDIAAGSQGFCLLNNVTIGAAYAKYNFNAAGIRNVAIVDFDVHHGNGTEHIVRQLQPKMRKIKVNETLKWGTEVVMDLSIPSCKLWCDMDDEQEVFFASIHAYDGIFYPGSGGLSNNAPSPTIINVPLERN